MTHCTLFTTVSKALPPPPPRKFSICSSPHCSNHKLVHPIHLLLLFAPPKPGIITSISIAAEHLFFFFSFLSPLKISNVTLDVTLLSEPLLPPSNASHSSCPSSIHLFISSSFLSRNLPSTSPFVCTVGGFCLFEPPKFEEHTSKHWTRGNERHAVFEACAARHVLSVPNSLV